MIARPTCDGTEAEIVSRLEIRPRDLVIESHPRYGVDTGALLSDLSSRGYEFPDRYFDGLNGILCGDALGRMGRPARPGYRSDGTGSGLG